jgi:hypothetical protein
VNPRVDIAGNDRKQMRPARLGPTYPGVGGCNERGGSNGGFAGPFGSGLARFSRSDYYPLPGLAWSRRCRLGAERALSNKGPGDSECPAFSFSALPIDQISANTRRLTETRETPMREMGH